jgi:hypothetical protein
MGRGGHGALPSAAHGAAVDARLGGVAAVALVVGLAGESGGFGALSWDRALLGLAVVVLLSALLVGVSRPGRAGGALLAALAALTAWTALSYVWSESPASALVEAQRVALYTAAAAAVLLCARRLPTEAIVAAIVVVACWNLVTRFRGIGAATGAGSEPVGYANGLALLCVLGLVLLPPLPRWAWIAAVPLVVVLVLQDSLGAYAALVVAAVVFAAPRFRLVAVAAGIALLLASPYVAGGHERQHYWRVAAREAQAHPVLGSGAGTYVNWWVRERDVPLQTQEAHSLYAETLAELGPVGLALVLLVFAIPLAATRRRDLAAGVAAYAVAAAVDFDWELAGVTVPALLVAALAVAPARSRPAPLRAVAPVAAVVAVAALLAYAGNARLAAAQDAARRGDFGVAAAEARAARRWMPYSPLPWLVLGDVTHDAGAYRRAAELDPADWLLWQRLAGVADGRLRRLAEAKAAQLNPLAGSTGG